MTQMDLGTTMANILRVSNHRFSLFMNNFVTYRIFLGPDLRASFESTHSFLSHGARGYSSMNEELVANQDELLEQMKTLIKLSQQNQIAIGRIQKTLEQNGIKLNMNQKKKETKVEPSIPEKSEAGEYE
jgi:hypothetical protein